MSRLGIPCHLPKRLTIAFPIWGLFDTNTGGDYHDLDKFVREHVERGFNCIRLEGGTGLTHDLEGKRRGPLFIHAPFGKYTTNRQQFSFGGEGTCDLMDRLIQLCRVCQKYNVYLIISSWYYLHTYWFLDNEINKSIYAIPAEDVFMSFAVFLHYILLELEAENLSDRIAFAEIFNEVPAIPHFLADMKQEDLSSIDFSRKHAEALSWLREQHPNILFAVDSDNLSKEQVDRIPDTLQVFNGHNYFLWGIYGGTLEMGEPVMDEYFQGKVSREDVIASRDLLMRLPKSSAGWYDRIAKCNDLDVSRIPDLEAYLSERLEQNWDSYIQRLDSFCDGYRRVMDKFPGIPIVCGEGVTYCSSPLLHWEEKSERYWEMVEIAMRTYKKLGLWGTLIKTCCGPEDPSWVMCKDKLKALNEMFLED